MSATYYDDGLVDDQKPQTVLRNFDEDYGDIVTTPRTIDSLEPPRRLRRASRKLSTRNDDE